VARGDLKTQKGNYGEAMRILEALRILALLKKAA
jgi:hypothetical protein